MTRDFIKVETKTPRRRRAPERTTKGPLSWILWVLCLGVKLCLNIDSFILVSEILRCLNLETNYGRPFYTNSQLESLGEAPNQASR